MLSKHQQYRCYLINLKYSIIQIQIDKMQIIGAQSTYINLNLHLFKASNKSLSRK